MTYRPVGVIALATIFIILAGLIILEAIYIWTILIPNEYQSLNLLIIQYNYTVGTPSYSAGMGDVYFFSAVQEIPRTIDTYNILDVGALIFAGIFLFTAVGLLEIKKWGYYLGLITGILSIIVGIFSLFNIDVWVGNPYVAYILLIFGMTALIFGVIIVAYLAGSVRHDFQ